MVYASQFLLRLHPGIYPFWVYSKVVLSTMCLLLEVAATPWLLFCRDFHNIPNSNNIVISKFLLTLLSPLSFFYGRGGEFFLLTKALTFLGLKSFTTKKKNSWQKKNQAIMRKIKKNRSENLRGAPNAPILLRSTSKTSFILKGLAFFNQLINVIMIGIPSLYFLLCIQ